MSFRIVGQRARKYLIQRTCTPRPPSADCTPAPPTSNLTLAPQTARVEEAGADSREIMPGPGGGLTSHPRRLGIEGSPTSIYVLH